MITKGKWKKGKAHINGNIPIKAPDGLQHIAIVINRMYSEPREHFAEVESNARAIECVPELIGSLKGLMATVKSCPKGTWGYRLYSDAKKIINKIEKVK
jgi:hypothetical protein